MVRGSRQAGTRTVAVAAFTLFALVAGREAMAAELTGSQVVQQMRAAVEPDKPSVRLMDLTVTSGAEKTTFQLVQARKQLPDGRRSLTVLLAPPAARGLAYLVEDKKGSTPVEYVYVPMVRRVRKFMGTENHTAFLDSDFTYADLGFLPTDNKDTLLGEEKIAGRDVYKVESVPDAEVKRWYYTKIATWIDKETLLPVQRDFYDPAGQVFKIETFGSATRVDGVPTPMQITMDTIGAQSKSTIQVTDVTYGAGLPDDLFSPAKLSQIAELIEKTGATKPKAKPAR
jgi:outer membrane lipoprotein-sorting protein